MVRRPAGPGEISWNPATGQLNPASLESIDAVVHLAGENVGARWTAGRKARIRDSRVEGTRLISETLARLAKRPEVMVSASAVGIYGDRGDDVLTESSALGNSADFLAQVGVEWEAAADPARQAGIRVVHPRFGLVLSRKGGALGRMLLPFRLGLGGRLGSGSQWMSWISLADAVEVIGHVLSNRDVHGPVNVTAPRPVTNREFTRTLGRVLARPTVFAVPAPFLRLLFGEMADVMLLASTRVVPARLTELGYRFQHADLETALRAALGRRGQ
jgi:uncharacterized protein (TIGR01777 family)